MRVECPHARLIGGRCTKTDEAVRPHQHRTAIGDAGFRRIKLRASGVDNRHELTPTRAEIVQTRLYAEKQAALD